MLALLFPGQGSQSLGMLAELAQQHDCVNTLFSEASEVLGYDLWALCQKGPEEKLNQTQFTQPALLVADVAVHACWALSATEKAAFLAGHSLGEYAALVVAEALSFRDAVALVAARGQYMQEAVPPGEGAMAAILGLTDDQVITLCAEVAGIVSPANFNSIGQVVIAGEYAAVEAAIVLAKERGAKIAKKIPVSVPSHCILMQTAADRMAEKLAKISIHKPNIPVIHNADVSVHDSAESIRNALIMQLTAPVRWVESIQWMAAQGVDQFIECGPGKVLIGLNKRILP